MKKLGPIRSCCKVRLLKDTSFFLVLTIIVMLAHSIIFLLLTNNFYSFTLVRVGISKGISNFHSQVED